MKNIEVDTRLRIGQWVADGSLAAIGAGLLLIAKSNADSGYEGIAAVHAYTATGLLITALLGSIKLSLDWRRASNEQG